MKFFWDRQTESKNSLKNIYQVQEKGWLQVGILVNKLSLKTIFWWCWKKTSITLPKEIWSFNQHECRSCYCFNKRFWHKLSDCQNCFPGDVIIKEGCVGTKMYFIQEGIVDIVMNNGEVASSTMDLTIVMLKVQQTLNFSGCYIFERWFLLWRDLPAHERAPRCECARRDVLQRLLPPCRPLQRHLRELSVHEAHHGEHRCWEVCWLPSSSLWSWHP